MRVAIKGDAAKPDEEHMALIRKMISDGLTDPEQERFQELHHRRSCKVLETPADELFTVVPTRVELPDKARIEPSEPCARCKEPVMKSKLEKVSGETVCRGCLE